MRTTSRDKYFIVGVLNSKGERVKPSEFDNARIRYRISQGDAVGAQSTSTLAATLSAFHTCATLVPPLASVIT
jgi:hypothetical protein